MNYEDDVEFGWTLGASFAGQQQAVVPVALQPIDFTDRLSDDELRLIMDDLSPVALLNAAKVSSRFRQQAVRSLKCRRVTRLLMEPVKEESALRIHITDSDTDMEYFDIPGQKQKISLEQYRIGFSFLLKFPSMVNASNLRIIINMESEPMPNNIELLRIPRLPKPLQVQELRWPVTGPVDFFNQVNSATPVELYSPNDVTVNVQEELRNTFNRVANLARI